MIFGSPFALQVSILIQDFKQVLVFDLQASGGDVDTRA